MQAADVASNMTAALNTYSLSADQAKRYIDSLNEVDNQFSTTSASLAQGIQHSAETAKLFGVDLDHLVGYITAIQSVTRESGTTIGNMLKTAMPRINMDKTQNILANIGVAVKDASGELRPYQVILEEVARKFDSLNKAQQTMVTEGLAGKMHITRMAALLSHMDIATKAATVSSTAYGSSLDENYKHMQSLSSKINQLTGSTQELSASLGESGLTKVLGVVISATTTFTKGITEVVNSGNLGVTAIGLLVTGVGAFGIGLATKIPLFASFTASIIASTRAMGAFTLSLMTNPLTAGLVVLTAAIAGFVAYSGSVKQAREEYEKFAKSAEESNTKVKEIEGSLNKVGSTTKQNVDDYQKMSDSLVDVANKFKTMRDEQYKKANDSHKSQFGKDMNIDPGKLSIKLDNSEAIAKLKEESASVGVNILEFKTWGEVIDAVNKKHNEMIGNIDKLTKNDLETNFRKQGDAADMLSKLMDDLNNNRKIGYKEAQELIAKEEGLSKAMYVENGIIKFNKQVLQELIDKRKQAAADVVKNMKAELESQKTALFAKLKLYGIEAKAVADLIRAKQQLQTQQELENFKAGKNPALNSFGALIKSQQTAKVTSEIDNVIDASKQIEDYQKLAESVGNVTEALNNTDEAKKKSKKASDEAAKAAKDQAQAEKDAAKAAEDARKKELDDIKNAEQHYQKLYDLKKQMLDLSLSTEEYALSRLNKNSEAYRKELEKIIAIKKEQMGLDNAEASRLNNAASTYENKANKAATYEAAFTSSDVTATPIGGGSYSGKYSKYINDAAKKYNIDPNLIAAVIQQESGFNSKSVSSSGAKGLMQLMPDTARSMGVKDLFNIEQNILGGTKYLAEQINTFGGNVKLALAAYNAGPGNVKKYNGIPPFAQTQNYVPSVLEYYKKFAGVSTATSSSSLDALFTQATKFSSSNHFTYDNTSKNIKGTPAWDTWAKNAVSDCSLFVQEMFKKFLGVDPGRDTEAQWNNKNAKKVDKKDLQPGDLVFFNKGKSDHGHVGVYAGDNAFYQMGTKGLALSNMNESYWKDSYTGARRFPGSTGSGVDSPANLSSDYQSMADDAKNKRAGLASQQVAHRQAIDDAEQKNVQSRLDEFNVKVQEQDKLLKDSQFRQSRLDQNSPEFRAEIDKQIAIEKEKQKIVHQSADYIRSIEEAAKKDTTLYSGDYLAEIKKTREELSFSWGESAKQINSLTFDKAKNQLSELADKTSLLDKQLSLSKTTMDLYDQGSVEYRQELERQASILNKKIDTEKENQRVLQDLLNVQGLLPNQIDELNNAYNDSIQKQRELQVEIKKTTDTLRNQIADNLTKVQDKYFAQLEKEHKKQTDNLEQQIKDSNDAYDTRIKQKEHELSLLDEQIQKEDRLKALQDNANEIAKAKADTRFEYINAQGQVELTYDKAKVSDLEKQRNDMLQQYQREDIKKARQDEIDALKNEKDQKATALQQQLDDLKTNYDKQVEIEKDKWTKTIEGIKDGTIGVDEILNGKDGKGGFYQKSIADLTKWGVDIKTIIDKVVADWQSLQNIQSSISSGGGSSVPVYNNTGGSSSGSTTIKNGSSQLPSGSGTYYKGTWTPATHHEGGEVGATNNGFGSSRMAQLANKIFNVKPNEQIVKALKGEIMIPPKNIPNGLNNIKNLASSIANSASNAINQITQKHYHFNNLTIKADSPAEFLTGIDFLIRSEQS